MKKNIERVEREKENEIRARVKPGVSIDKVGQSSKNTISQVTSPSINTPRNSLIFKVNWQINFIYCKHSISDYYYFIWYNN